MNIKERETHELARELAKETGETMTQAIKVALRERLARIRKTRDAKARAAELVAIGRSLAKTLREKPIDHGELLYDERGLPR